MECNKDEAIRAKDLAEKKMMERDFGRALGLAVKANKMFPGLDGATQLVEVLNVLVAHENKVNGEVDWYAVLGADFSADEETLKKHYRRLASALHPDNNKSTGAAKAFKIVSAAWNLLSNKAERTKYDDKMRARSSSKSQGYRNQKGVAGAARVVVLERNKPKRSRKLSRKGIRYMLIEKAKKEIRNILKKIQGKGGMKQY